MLRCFARPTKKRQASQLTISVFFSEKIKEVFDCIFIKGRTFIIADTTASLRKEDIHIFTKRDKISLGGGGKIYSGGGIRSLFLVPFLRPSTASTTAY